jgi:hypothetical protein
MRNEKERQLEYLRGLGEESSDEPSERTDSQGSERYKSEFNQLKNKHFREDQAMPLEQASEEDEGYQGSEGSRMSSRMGSGPEAPLSEVLSN